MTYEEHVLRLLCFQLNRRTSIDKTCSETGTVVRTRLNMHLTLTDRQR